MLKLTDTQTIILSAAAQRPDGNVLPLPGSLRGGAAAKVVGALLSRGLIREDVVDDPRSADPAMNRIWRNLPEPDGRGVLLFVTAEGLEAIGVEPDTAAQPADEPDAPASAPQPAAEPQLPNTGALPRPGSKLALLAKLLFRPEGASLEEMVAGTGWRQHSVRGALAGALRRKFGLQVVSAKDEGGVRRYSASRT